MSEKSVVLVSGGMDSYLALMLAKRQGEVVEGVFVNYGQPCISRERTVVQAWNRFFKISIKEVILPLKSFSGSRGFDKTTSDSWMDYVVPMRNLWLIMAGATRANELGASVIHTGIRHSALGTQTFPDTFLDFIQSAEVTINKAIGSGNFSITTLGGLKRWEIFKAAYDLDMENRPDGFWKPTPKECKRTFYLSGMINHTRSGYDMSPPYDKLYEWGHGPSKEEDWDVQIKARAEAWWKFCQEVDFDPKGHSLYAQ